MVAPGGGDFYNMRKRGGMPMNEKTNRSTRYLAGYILTTVPAAGRNHQWGAF